MATALARISFDEFVRNGGDISVVAGHMRRAMETGVIRAEDLPSYEEALESGDGATVLQGFEFLLISTPGIYDIARCARCGTIVVCSHTTDVCTVSDVMRS